MRCQHGFDPILSIFFKNQVQTDRQCPKAAQLVELLGIRMCGQLMLFAVEADQKQQVGDSHFESPRGAPNAQFNLVRCLTTQLAA